MITFKFKRKNGILECRARNGKDHYALGSDISDVQNAEDIASVKDRMKSMIAQATAVKRLKTQHDILKFNAR